MSFTIPPIPTSVDTKTKSPQNINGQPNPVPQLPENTEQGEPQSAKVTFEMPFHLFQAFQEVVKKTPYLEGQEVYALLQAIDLWMQATTNSLEGNQIVFLNKNGLTTHTNLNPTMSQEEFNAQINAFHAERKINVDRQQAAAAEAANKA